MLYAVIILVLLTLSLYRYKKQYYEIENALDWLCVDEQFNDYVTGYERRMLQKVKIAKSYNTAEAKEAINKFFESVAILKHWSEKEATSNFLKHYRYMYFLNKEKNEKPMD